MILSLSVLMRIKTRAYLRALHPAFCIDAWTIRSLEPLHQASSMDRGAAQLIKLTVLSFFAISLLFLPSLEATDVRYCDKKLYPVKVQGVDISPDPVLSGSPATFNISASTDQAISGGKLVIDVSYFAIHVHTETHDLCEEASCPIAVGDFVLSHSQTLPGFTPPGSYTLKMTLEDEGNQLLTCIRFSFKIGLGSSVSDT